MKYVVVVIDDFDVLCWVAINFFAAFFPSLFFSRSITIAICADDRKHVTLFSIFMSNQFKSLMISLARWFFYLLRLRSITMPAVVKRSSSSFIQSHRIDVDSLAWLSSERWNQRNGTYTKKTCSKKTTHIPPQTITFFYRS